VTFRVLSDDFRKVKRKLLEYSGHFDIADHGDIKGYGCEALRYLLNSPMASPYGPYCVDTTEKQRPTAIECDFCHGLLWSVQSLHEYWR
jgi:hypothetical protein